jgi:plastocyanin domain-containing protein
LNIPRKADASQKGERRLIRTARDALAQPNAGRDTDDMTRWALVFVGLLACKASQGTAQAPTSDGKPVYAVSVTERGFEPTRIEVPPDRDVVVRFTRKVKDTCGDSVVVQGDPVKHMLPLDKPVDVPLRSPKTGQIRFACGMDMFRGALVVAGG